MYSASTLVRIAEQHPKIFSEEDIKWMWKNPELVWAFVHEAERRKRTYFHYSAMLLAGELRFHTLLRENASAYKVGNQCAPILSRLFALATGDANFFDYQVTEKHPTNMQKYFDEWTQPCLMCGNYAQFRNSLTYAGEFAVTVDDSVRMCVECDADLRHDMMQGEGE